MRILEVVVMIIEMTGASPLGATPPSLGHISLVRLFVSSDPVSRSLIPQDASSVSTEIFHQ